MMMYPFDLIVMDYHMQPFNGDKYIRDIRQNEHLDGIPIVFYSQDVNVDLASQVKGLMNIRVTTRGSVEELISSLLF
jgi:CheY-like chemotaxis protein